LSFFIWPTLPSVAIQSIFAIASPIASLATIALHEAACPDLSPIRTDRG
jgi:hypothetical protein